LKIAYFVNHYPKVSHSFIRREILALERQGFEVQRIALRGWADPLPDPQDQSERQRTSYVLRDGMWSLALPMIAALIRSPLRLLSTLALAARMARESDRPLPYHLGYVAEACRIVPWMKAFGARRIHAHFGTNSAEIALLARELGGPPYSFTIHGPDEFFRPIGLKEKVRRSSFTVAISCFGRSQVYLRSRYEDWPKIEIVHCGLETEFYSGAATLATTARRLICVGRLCPEKGQHLLIEAAARLVAKGVQFELVLAGDGPMRSELERAIANGNLGKFIRITGWIDSKQVREEILSARALVLPSFAEGLPVVIMEAMSLRRPVLSTYIAGIPELVQPGQNGWLFPAGSVQSLCDAMEECLSLPVEDLQRMGDSAHRRVLARHSIDSEAGKLAALFRREEITAPRQL
jgi:colanic acid/amylovoran biosynthesis glycosyltransferase